MTADDHTSHYAKGFEATCKLDAATDASSCAANPADKALLRKIIRDKTATLNSLAKKDRLLTKALSDYRAQVGEINNITNFIEWGMRNGLPQQDVNAWRIHLRKHFGASGERGRPTKSR